MARIFDRQNPFDFFTEEEFRIYFRLYKRSSLIRIEKLNHRPTKRHAALNPLIMVTAILRFVACESYQRVIGDTLQLAKVTVAVV